MSRVGKKPVAIPEKVKVSLSGQVLSAEGPKGKLSLTYPAGVKAVLDDKAKLVTVSRADEAPSALHGTFRALTANLLAGVATGYEKKLEIQGVGFRAAMKGNSQIQLSVGFANQITVDIPSGVTVQCPDATHIVVTGADKQKVGEVAARIRAARPPDVYQGKGIRYQGEHVRKKAGKASFGAGAS